MTKILNVFWFNNGGIVRVEHKYEGIKYYIRSMEFNQTEELDARYIADWGNTFPKEAGDALFGVKE